MTPTRTTPLRLDDRYVLEDGAVYLSGLQALVRLPFDINRYDRRNGADTAVFVSGYEGSPLAGYDLELARRADLMAVHGVTHQPGLNEELAANAVQGTQLVPGTGRMRGDAVVGIWYGKAPGLDRATDAIRHANLGGTHPRGGVLALVGDDVVAKSSTVPSASEMALAELCMPTLVPADAQDVLDLGLHGLAMSRACGLWTGFKIATSVADGSCTAEVSPDRVRPVAPDVTFDGQPYTHVPSARFLQPTLGLLEHSLLHRRIEIARRYARANGLNRVVHRAGGDRLGIVAAGSTYLDVRQALTQLGIKDDDLATLGIRLLKVGLVWPLDADLARDFASGLREVVVVEEKRPFLEAALKECLYGASDRPLVSGKMTPEGRPLLRPDGDLSPDLIATALAQRLLVHTEHAGARGWLESRDPSPSRTVLPLAVRTPFFCSGCPHNRSTEVPAGSLVGAGIGCHGMAALMPSDRVGDILGLTQMGGEGAPWIGMAPYVDVPHLIQNLGDGTFHHSGSLAIRAAVAAGSRITFKLLHNSTVAMTGGQQAVGQMSLPAIVALLHAEGVRRVVVTTEDPDLLRRSGLPRGTDVRHRDDLIAVQEELAREPGVTVLIHDQECATELRRKRKRGLAKAAPARAFINERVCEGCGDCGQKSNCLSVQPVATEFGRKTQIHQPSCNSDLSCLDGDCPSFLSVIPGKGRVQVSGPPDLPSDALPEPVVTARTDRFSLRITGIGGTGIVTAAQVVATAAVLSGRHVRALDQTGLAQKGGAVVSDVKITQEPTAQASKLAEDECDLYLGCDLLVAASPTNLQAASPARTAAVVSTAEVPTGAMVVDPTLAFPESAATLGRIQDATDTSRSAYVDAHGLTRKLFGDDQFANVFLLGVAVQLGTLPVPAAQVEAALELNGVQVDRNIQAFRRGRQLVSDPDALRLAAEPQRASSLNLAEPVAGVNAPAASELARLVRVRYDELVAYQDQRYAGRYAELVEQVRAAEARTVPGSTALTEVVAVALHKLMAYKDEYEVARLCVDPALLARLRAEFGEDASYAYRLHPPVLRALGMKRKIAMGPWVRPLLRALSAGRRLRGTALDPFGRAEVRRVERQLVEEYIELLERLCERLGPDNHAATVEVAGTPDLVRGYEQVKLRSVERYRARLAELVPDLVGGFSDGPTAPASA